MGAWRPILALIPGYQEGPRIAAVVTAARRHLPVVVVDDGSTDDTAAQAEAAGATVIRQVPNAGKGAALRAGFRHALEHGADAVVTLDADGQHDPDEIPALPGRLRGATGRSWSSVGATSRAMPPVRRLSNTLGGWVFSAAVGRRVPDNQSGYRLIGRRLMRALLDSTESGLRVRGRDDRPLHRARPADRVGADPDDLCGRAEPHPAVAHFTELPAGQPRRPPDRARRRPMTALAPVGPLARARVVRPADRPPAWSRRA